MLVNRSKETLDALLLSLFSVRSHWAGPVLVVHWGEENLSLTIACAQLGVTLRSVGELGADAEDWPAGVSQPFKRALVVQPGMLAVAALDGVFAAKCAITEEFAPLLVEGGEVMAARCGCATDFRYGPEAMVVFLGESERWTDAAWQMRSELEAEAAIAMAAIVRVPKDTTIACIITRDGMEDFQSNWLTWRFPAETPVLLVLVGFERDELWLPSMNTDVQIASLNEKQASDTVWLLRTLAQVCRTKRVAFLPASAAALPGADLWVNIAEGDTAQHCSKIALNEVQVTGNRFVPQPLFATLPVERLLKLADAAEVSGANVEDISLLLHSARLDIRMQDMAEYGWAVESAHFYLPPDGVTFANTRATETLRQRADGLLQLADDVVVISLPERTDRRERMEYMMAREGVWFRFVDGVRVKDEEIEPYEISEVGRQSFKMAAGFKKYLRGMAGCRRAHLRVLEAAKAKGLRSLMIIEDDMVLETGWLEKLRAALLELPKGWLQLYFSANNFSPSAPVSENLRRLGGAYQTTAILYSQTGIEAAIQCLRHSRNEIDFWMGRHLHPFGNSYVVHPCIAFQQGGVSDIMSYDRGVTA